MISPQYNADADERRKIEKLAKQIRKDDTLYPLIRGVLSGSPLTDSAKGALLEAIVGGGHGRWKRKLLACWALGIVPLTEEERSLAESRLAAILTDRPRRKIGWLLTAGCLFSYFGFIYIAYVSIVDSPINRVREAAATALARVGSDAAIESLADAMAEMKGSAASGDKSVRIAATRSLTELLTRLPGSGWGRVPQSAVSTACRLLTDSNTVTVVESLRLLRLIGGGSAIEAVERCAKKGKAPAVREEALHTLEVLRERRLRELAEQRLLRPAGQTVADEQSLLRPAASQEHDQANLLRPTSDDMSVDE